MIDPQLLQIIGQWHLQVNNINDLTDEILLKFLDDHVKKDKSSHCRVHEIFREELKMDLNLKSPYARLDALLSSMAEITRKHNLQGVFDPEEGKKNWVKFMLNALRPYRLKQHMRTIIEVTNPHLQKDPRGFFEEVSKHIPMFEVDVPAERQKISNKKRPREGGNNKPNPRNKRSKQEMLTCFKCQQPGHRMTDYPLKPSSAEQKQLIKQQRTLMQSNKPAQKFSYTVVARISQATDTSGRDKYNAKVQVIFANGRLECGGILESGSDLT